MLAGLEKRLAGMFTSIGKGGRKSRQSPYSDFPLSIGAGIDDGGQMVDSSLEESGTVEFQGISQAQKAFVSLFVRNGSRLFRVASCGSCSSKIFAAGLLAATSGCPEFSITALYKGGCFFRMGTSRLGVFTSKKTGRKVY